MCFIEVFVTIPGKQLNIRHEGLKLLAVIKSLKNTMTVTVSIQDRNYPCAQCDYIAKYKSVLKDHTKSIHERILYHCNQCEFKTRHKRCLLDHIQSKHEGIRYPCKQCSFVTAQKETLKSHQIKA